MASVKIKIKYEVKSIKTSNCTVTELFLLVIRLESYLLTREN